MADVLARAPLAEAVFEMRWAGVASELPLGTDPGYPNAFDAISAYATERELTAIVDIHPAYTGFMGSVSRRLRHAAESFPVLQIGHGVFAANESTRYEWSAFKRFAADSAAVVVDAYPKLATFSLRIDRLELRYVIVFDASLVNTVSFVDFLSQGTNMRLEIPKELAGGHPLGSGRLILEYPVGDIAGVPTSYMCDLKSVAREGAPFISFEHRVVSQGEGIVGTKTAKAFRTKLDRWLEAAHKIASPAFRSIMSKRAVEQMK